MKLVRLAVASVAVVTVATQAASAAPPEPTLEGRAVLPVATYASGPIVRRLLRRSDDQRDLVPDAVAAGARVSRRWSPGAGRANTWPWLTTGSATRPTRSTSCSGRTTSRPDFKTAKGGTGAVDVGDFVQFRDPNGVIGFPIQRPDRLLTGADLDPESLQRGKDGDLWMGDEFGPWILHFDETGVLLEPPFRVPAGLVGSTSVTGFLESPSSPFISSAEPRRPWPGAGASRRWRRRPTASTCTDYSKGATVQDPNKDRRYLLEFSIRDRAFTGRVWQYRTQPTVTGVQQCCFMADMGALDQHRMVVIERDNGRGAPVPPSPATFSRGVYVIDLRNVGSDGFLEKTRIVDLTAIADPDLVSLPPIHSR